MNPKYKILVNHGTEGLSFEPDEFDTIKQAVDFATKTILYNPFQIVTIINWIDLIDEKEPFGQL